MTKYRTDFALNHDREMNLLKVFKEITASTEHISLEDVLQKLVNSPSARFWVTHVRATRVIRRMLKGRNPHIGFRTKREMYDEILRRVVSLRESYPKLPIAKAVRVVVGEQAPKFYMTTRCAYLLLQKARLHEKEEKIKLWGIIFHKRKNDDMSKLDGYVE